MKRFGDDLPCSGISEAEVEYQHGRNVTAIYGSSGVRFSTFSKPIGFPKKHKALDLFSLFTFRRNKLKQNRG